ncbi:hypothetical protein AaE_013531 [Aphanomyces astaci]|uniref:Uncharacterized protein n=1 Tax=Aphanomyces astaci TaxID=112090 RepID=A0A6A4ZAZ1_APHAT|nr:hypothetical protein AaE_013531 [Aphanomyces astaci]
MSIARLFVQVIQEELSVFLREIAKSTMGDTTTALESLVETAVGLGLMLDTWQTHTQAKIFDRAPTPTTQWTHDTFAKVCATILATKHTVLACIYAQWRRECTQSYFPNVAQHGWSSVKPYFGDSRISAGVQCLVFRVDSLVSRVVSACAMPFGNAVTTRPMQCMCWSMVLHGLECFSALYKAIQVSRARLWQFKMDVLYMLCGMYRSTQRIRELDTADDDMSMWAARCEDGMIEWLQILALVFAPAGLVIEEMTSRKKAELTPTESHLERTAKEVLLDDQMHVLVGLLCIHNDQNRLKPWQSHNILLGGDVKPLKQIDLQVQLRRIEEY